MDHAPSPPPAHAGPVPYVPPGRNDHPHNESAPVAGPAASSHLGHHNFGAPGFTPQSGDRPRYDPQHFPRQINANKHFAWRGAREWQDQPGYHYRRWGYGDYLPAGWFVAQFWIDDYFDYDLPVPPYGYEWVRSGPDALLVDTYTGEVVEAVYGVF
jgi:Ni/Co efflux regulator RcnB